MHNRAVARFENPERGVYSNVVGIMCPPVEIGLTDLPKTEEGGGAPVCPSPTALIAWKGGGLRNKDSEMKLSPKGHSKLSSKIFFYSG